MTEAEPALPEDALRASPIRTVLVKARSYQPQLVELTHPRRYVSNLRLANSLRTGSFTMIGRRRARNLIELARRLDRERLPGAIVDCGVWNGGSTILMGVGAPTREIWAFDSFEGLPKPGPRDPDAHADWEGKNVGSDTILRRGFAEYAGGESRLHVVKGWFSETVAQAAASIGEIAMLHIDADWYDSVMLVLDALYDQVVPGGYVAIDDLKTWQGAQGAVADFRSRRGISAPLRSDHYWRKP